MQLTRTPSDVPPNVAEGRGTEAGHRYHQLLDRSLAPMCVHDGRRLLFVNAAAVSALRAASAADVVGRPIDDFIHPGSLATVLNRIAGLRDDGDITDPNDVVLLRVDGSPVTVQAVAALSVEAGRATYEVIFRDPSVATTVDAIRAEASLPDTTWSDHRIRTVLDLLQEGVVVMDCRGRFEFTNAAARRILGADAGDLVGMHHSDRGVDFPLFDAQGGETTREHPVHWIRRTGLTLGSEVICVDRVDGAQVWVTGQGRLLDPGDPERSSVLFAFTDITEHHDARERLRHDATHDWLTGLPNRSHMLERADLALAAPDDGRLVAALFIDLDKLKAVNDRYGHPIGDEVLRIAAQRMQSVARPQDLLARLGGDEFVALLVGPAGSGEVDDVAGRLHCVLLDEIVVGDVRVRIGASIGVTTVIPGDARSAADLLRDADAAMYHAKAQGPGNTSHFRPGR